jgi:hypothetical protein
MKLESVWEGHAHDFAYDDHGVDTGEGVSHSLFDFVDLPVHALIGF